MPVLSKASNSISAVADPEMPPIAESTQMDPAPEPFGRLLQLCALWEASPERQTFALIVKTCLEENVLTLADFKDELRIMPAAALFYADGTAMPPASVTKSIIAFVKDRAETFTLCQPRPQETYAVERFRNKMAASSLH